MFKAWFIKRPELLKAEKQAYADKGFNLILDEKRLKDDKVVIFQGEVEALNGSHKIRVEYPSIFPDNTLKVYELCCNYPRHQHPYNKDICLSEWESTLTGAQRVEEAIELINIYAENPDKISDVEVDAPEPASRWYEYNPFCAILFPSSMINVPKASWGDFNASMLAFNISKYISVRLAISKIDILVSGRRQGEILSKAENLKKKPEIHGTWIYVDEAPSFSCRTFDGFRELFIERSARGDHHLIRIKKRNNHFNTEQMRDVEMFGIVYPEEGPKRGSYHNQWLVGLSFTSNGEVNKIMLQPSIISEGDLYFQRFMHLRALAKKRIAILGLGAIGSFIAKEIARAGVGNIYLVDFDGYDADNVVRQDIDLRDVGIPKVYAIENHIKQINPFCNVSNDPFVIGGVISNPTTGRYFDSFEILVNRIKDCDLVISTLTSQSLEYPLNEVLTELNVPAIYAYNLNGAWGGQVFRSLQGKACFECFAYHKDDGNTGNVSIDENAEEIYPLGCMAPTFQGAGFDASIISNLATRLAVQTLLNKEHNSYPDSAYNLINWNSRGEASETFPSIENILLGIHEKCPHHKQ